MNKHIEEMVKHIPVRIFINNLTDNSVLINENYRRVVAEHIYNAGYRKQSDTAKEIFAKLKTVMIDEHRYPIIGELKKIYEVTEDEICI